MFINIVTFVEPDLENIFKLWLISDNSSQNDQLQMSKLELRKLLQHETYEINDLFLLLFLLQFLPKYDDMPKYYPPMEGRESNNVSILIPDEPNLVPNETLRLSTQQAFTAEQPLPILKVNETTTAGRPTQQSPTTVKTGPVTADNITTTTGQLTQQLSTTGANVSTSTVMPIQQLSTSGPNVSTIKDNQPSSTVGLAKQLSTTGPNVSTIKDSKSTSVGSTQQLSTTGPNVSTIKDNQPSSTVGPSKQLSTTGPNVSTIKDNQPSSTVRPTKQLSTTSPNVFSIKDNQPTSAVGLTHQQSTIGNTFPTTNSTETTMSLWTTKPLATTDQISTTTKDKIDTTTAVSSPQQSSITEHIVQITKNKETNSPVHSTQQSTTTTNTVSTKKDNNEATQQPSTAENMTTTATLSTEMPTSVTEVLSQTQITATSSKKFSKVTKSSTSFLDTTKSINATNYTSTTDLVKTNVTASTILLTKQEQNNNSNGTSNTDKETVLPSSSQTTLNNDKESSESESLRKMGRKGSKSDSDTDTSEEDNSFWIKNELPLYKIKKALSLKKKKTVWEKMKNNYVKNYRTEVFDDDTSMEPNMDSSSQEDDIEEQYNPRIKITKITKERKKSYLETKGSHCESKMDCTLNEHCIRGVCTKCFGIGCKYLYQYVVQKRISRKCTWTSKCPKSHHCDNHGYCADSCDLTHNHCHEDYHCLLGACIPLLAIFTRVCNTDNDCLKGEVCGPQRVCTRPCDPQKFCGPLEICSNGFCHRIGDNTTQTNIKRVDFPFETQKKQHKCRSYKDCPGGMSCSNHGHCKRVCSKRHFACSKGKHCG